MQNALKSMNGEETWSIKLLKLKYRRGEQIIQILCRIGSSQKLGAPLFSLKKFGKFNKNSSES